MAKPRPGPRAAWSCIPRHRQISGRAGRAPGVVELSAIVVVQPAAGQHRRDGTAPRGIDPFESSGIRRTAASNMSASRSRPIRLSVPLWTMVMENIKLSCRIRQRPVTGITQHQAERCSHGWCRRASVQPVLPGDVGRAAILRHCRPSHCAGEAAVAARCVDDQAGIHRPTVPFTPVACPPSWTTSVDVARNERDAGSWPRIREAPARTPSGCTTPPTGCPARPRPPWRRRSPDRRARRASLPAGVDDLTPKL